MKKIIIFLISLFFIACSNNEEIKNDFLFEEYKNGEQITLKSVNGGEKTIIRTKNGFAIKGEENKTLMFDLFGTFCTPCKEEALELTKLWKDNIKDFIIIGLTHFEKVNDEDVKKFAQDYGAYYFLSNSNQNNRLSAQILKDINYPNMEQVPFKVILKNGIYQKLTDYWNDGKQNYFYIGKIPTSIMQKDIDKINKE